MSLDGSPLTIPADISSVEEPPGFDCIHDGWVYARQNSGFAKCSKGYVHCLKCEQVAHRFRKGYTCTHE